MAWDGVPKILHTKHDIGGGGGGGDGKMHAAKLTISPRGGVMVPGQIFPNIKHYDPWCNNIILYSSTQLIDSDLFKRRPSQGQRIFPSPCIPQYISLVQG